MIGTSATSYPPMRVKCIQRWSFAACWRSTAVTDDEVMGSFLAIAGSTVSNGRRPKNALVPAETPEHEQDEPEQEEAHPDDERDGHPEDLLRRVRVLGVGEIDRRLDEQEPEDRRADERPDPDEEEVLDGLRELAPVVDRAREAGQRVVEGDHQRERRERVEERVLGQDVERHVPRDREPGDHRRREPRACGSAGGPPRTCAAARSAAPWRTTFARTG